MTRVFIVAQVRLYREGLEQAIGRVDDIEVVGTASGAEEAGARIAELRPDLALVDVPLVMARSVVREFLEVAPGLRVVALAIDEGEGEIVAWAASGVSGYVTRDSTLQELVSIIRSVTRGEMPCSPRVAATLLAQIGLLAAQTRRPAIEAVLTYREQQIIELIEQGLSNKEIAQRLLISLPTVKNHVHKIFEKLDVHRRSEALSRLGRQYRMVRT